MELWKNPVFLSLVEALQECVLALDPDGRVVWVQCPESLLDQPENLVGKSLGQVFPDNVAAAYAVAMQTLERTGLPQKVNYHLHIEGRDRHFSARLACPEIDGERQQTIVAVWDVTRQTLSHQTMLESEAFYRLLAENSSDVIVVETLDGEYLYVSPGVTQVLGLKPEGIVGRNRADVIHPADIERMRQRSPAGKMVPPPEGARVRFRVRNGEGDWVWLESTLRTFKWQGRPAMLSIARDITNRHVAEVELKEARKRAELANRAKSDFLGSISHDLRTPLHGMLGMSELLEQTHLTPEQQEYLGAIQESGNTLLARLDDLLDLSKIESGNLDLQDVDFDLVEAVEGLVDILGNQAAAKGIDLFCHVPPEVPPVVRGDSQRLRQVLINLIDNAVKHTHQGEVNVRVGLARDAAGEPLADRLQFSVRDTGVGLDKGQLDRIMGREPNGDRPRWRPAPGAGLGLLIGRQLVGLMGGELQVTSEPGGTVFAFELPLPASDHRRLAVKDDTLTGKRVLATDDNATNRQLIREYLEHAGAEVEVTSGGVETIRNLLDDPAYHCVVLNANLPDLDGFATAAMIRSNRTLETLPLVLMISSMHSEEVRRSKELKVDATLTKPVRRDVLVRAVHDVVAARRPTDEGQPGGTVLVVEDNEVNMRLARDILRRAGYGVVSARNGTEALEQVEQHQIDAVLMDIQLPDMDGLEATARIRDKKDLGEIPIIAMTAHAMKGDVEHFLNAGVDDCLSKPVNRLELLGCLNRELQRRN